MLKIKDNEKIFCSIWNKNKHFPFLLISSNSGTGKTTKFKWQFLRDAYKNKRYLDIIYRWDNDLDEKFTSGAFLTTPQNASKRLLKFASKLAIKKIDNIPYVIVKETGERIARGITINVQEKIKSTENPLYTSRGLFDEILSDGNRYVPDECFRFCRLSDTTMRQRHYQMVGLYNNSSPFFPYDDYFEKNAMKKVVFTAKSYDERPDDMTSFQSCLRRSKYNEVYKNNNYKFYTEFYKEVDTFGKETLFYLQIENKLFAVKDLEEFYILETKKKIKKNREVFALNLANNDFLMATSSNGIVQVLQTMLNNRLLFTNNKNNTIYIKELANNLNLCYTI